MENHDTSAAIYSEAKSEYTKQLVYNFQPVLLRFFLDRYTEAKATPSVSSKSKSALSEFQDSLSQIPEWNIDKVQRETASLIQNVQCDYIEDLITAVFIAHTKILSAIRLNSKPRQKIRITVPKPDHFMHRSLSECSRLLWSNIYLFNDSTTSLDRQKNMTEVNRFLEEGIVQAIRNLLPVKSILRDSLQEDDEDGMTGEMGEVTPLSPEPLVAEAPVAETPLAETPLAETPLAEAPVTDTSVAEAPLSETSGVPETPLSVPEVAVAPELSLSEPPVPVDTLVAIQELPQNPSSVEGSNDVKIISDTRPPKVVTIEKQDTDQQNTLVVDTEKSVGFTGIDSVYGISGDAEVKPMVDEGSDEFKILGDSEELDMDEFEDLDTVQTVAPLSSDDYETL